MLMFPGMTIVPEGDGKPFMKGAFGSLYKAKNIATHETVVYKKVDCLQAQTVNPNMDCTQEPTIHYLLSLSRHPNIIACLTFSFDTDPNTSAINTIHMVLEHASKGDLFDYIGQNGMPLPAVVVHGYAICSAIAFCHHKGIIHRDLKPENILMFDAGPNDPPQVKLCDFGLSKNMASIDRCTTHCGTVEFMAPEVCISGHCNPSAGYTYPADLYSIGILLYHMRTGDIPYGRLPLDTKTRNKRITKFLLDERCHPRLENIREPVLLSLISNLVSRNPASRMLALQTLSHPLFSLRFVYDPDDFARPTLPSNPDTSFSSF